LSLLCDRVPEFDKKTGLPLGRPSSSSEDESARS
jgi:hypothetical protein